MATALERLAALLEDPLISRREAVNMLARYTQRHSPELSDREASILSLLQEVNAETMGTRSHRNDTKREDRSFGRKLHRNRTGSRGH